MTYRKIEDYVQVKDYVLVKKYVQVKDYVMVEDYVQVKDYIFWKDYVQIKGFVHIKDYIISTPRIMSHQGLHHIHVKEYVQVKDYIMSRAGVISRSKIYPVKDCVLVNHSCYVNFNDYSYYAHVKVSRIMSIYTGMILQELATHFIYELFFFTCLKH